MKNKFTAIVLAGGKGSRMNTNVAKQYLLLAGKPVLYYSLACFQQSDRIEDIILVVGSGQEDYVREQLTEKYHLTKVRQIVPGGKERYDSVRNGLKALQEEKEQESENESYVLIHDGARPFLTQEIIDRVCREVLTEKACAVGMPVKDTIKITNEEGYVTATPDRRRVWQVQTPQAFDLKLICEAYQNWEDSDEKDVFCITDDAGMVERFTGQKVKMVEGSYRNIKITTPEDLEIGERFLS